MTRTPLILALGAAAALAGCNQNDHTITAGSGPGDENTTAANAPVALPPSVVSSKIYRCADNKVVYVDWLSDNLSANIRTEQGGTPNHVAAAEAGKPMTSANGYSMTGAPGGSSVKIATPAHGAQSCKA